MQTKFLIVAESGAGKDTLVDKLVSDLKLKKLISYATRPIRTEDVNDKYKHTFITDSEADELLKTEQIIAYTKIGDYRYFATMKQFIESDIYIIDPIGVEYLKLHNKGNKDINIITIYIKVDVITRMGRAMERGDNFLIMHKRFTDEEEQFEKFRTEGNFDWCVDNTDFEHCVSVLKTIIGGYK